MSKVTSITFRQKVVCRDKMVKACELMDLLELRGQTTNNNNDAAPSSENEVQVQQNKNLAAVGSKMWGGDRRQISICQSRFDSYSGDV